jgi:hypothetical protein
MIIKQSTQKPALIAFSGLVVITSLVFSSQASLASYNEAFEASIADSSPTLESAAMSDSFSLDISVSEDNDGLLVGESSNYLQPADMIQGMIEEREAARVYADRGILAPSAQRMEELPSERFRPVGETPSKKDFDPGNIISDFVFLNKDAMTLTQIESFIDYKGKDCVAGEMPCLKDFVGKVPETPAGDKGICVDIPKLTKVSAAEMIYIVAHACGINPQVLLVTIQKEQGLLEASRPTNYMYRAAMGHNCPDGNPSACGSVTGGFWNQLREGAEQKLWYGNENSPFTYLPVGETITRPYHPNETCGAVSFKLKNRATASLYYYTPYVPNDAALYNMTGLGNDCSAYGNRNFFRLFNEWFGDSRAKE